MIDVDTLFIGGVIKCMSQPDLGFAEYNNIFLIILKCDGLYDVHHVILYHCGPIYHIIIILYHTWSLHCISAGPR